MGIEDSMSADHLSIIVPADCFIASAICTNSSITEAYNLRCTICLRGEVAERATQSPYIGDEIGLLDCDDC